MKTVITVECSLRGRGRIDHVVPKYSRADLLPTADAPEHLKHPIRSVPRHLGAVLLLRFKVPRGPHTISAYTAREVLPLVDPKRLNDSGLRNSKSDYGLPILFPCGDKKMRDAHGDSCGLRANLWPVRVRVERKTECYWYQAY